MASTDSLEDVTAFAEKNEANFPVLSDDDKVASKAFGVLSGMGFAKRWTFYVGSDGKIIEIDKSVNPRSAGPDLAANLQRLSLGTKGLGTKGLGTETADGTGEP